MRLLVVLIITIGLGISLPAQMVHNILIDPSATPIQTSSSIKPGIFYFSFWIPNQNSVFEYVSEPGDYNTFRDNKFGSECWKWSSGLADVLNRMDQQNFRDWLEWQQIYAEKVVVKFGSMPYWLSSSDDWTEMNDQSWRVFMTHPPENYNAWNEAIQAVVNKIESWGIHPYYEIWNEPDGEYWQNTDASLLELYKNTALSIKLADPLAKVGGLGMHTWWRAVDPSLHAEQEAYKSPVFGFKPEYVAEQYSILYDLMDSVINVWSDEGVPLDFISFHSFNWHSYEMAHTADQLRAKMAALGYNSRGFGFNYEYPQLYISEWQTTYHIQEQRFQPGLFLKFINNFNKAGIEMNSIAAVNDFGTDTENEFNNDWGMFSQNVLVKPVFKGLMFLNNIIRNGTMLPVTHNDDLEVFASTSGDTLRILISNYAMPTWWYHNYNRFAWSCFEKLLYDSTSVNNMLDFMNQGMSSVYWGNAPTGEYGTVDLILMGQEEIPQNLPDGMQFSLQLARDQFIHDSASVEVMHEIQIDLEGITNKNLTAYVSTIDSNQNNIIFLYDSLKSEAGYTHQQAIDSLRSCTFPGGCFGVFSQSDSLHFSGNSFSLLTDPNSLNYVVIPGIDISVGIGGNLKETEHCKVFPNPVDYSSRLVFNNNNSGRVLVSLYSSNGKHISELYEGTTSFGYNSIDIGSYISYLKAGIYMIRIQLEDGVKFKKIVVL